MGATEEEEEPNGSVETLLNLFYCCEEILVIHFPISPPLPLVTEFPPPLSDQRTTRKVKCNAVLECNNFRNEMRGKRGD